MLHEISPAPDTPVLVIGGAGIDFVGRLDEDLEERTSNPSRIRTSYGGVSRNVAENLARLGQPVTFISVVGEDQSGDQLLDHLDRVGVQTEHVLRCDDCPTGSYLAVLNKTGGLEFALYDMRAMAELTSEYLRKKLDVFKKSSLLFLDANLSKKTIRTAFSLARKAKIPVCADPTSTKLTHRLLPYIDRLKLITPNHSEAGRLCDLTVDLSNRDQAISAAKHLVSQGAEIAIITLAQFGVSYATSETQGNIPAIRTDIVNPTGAGDALTATVLFGLLNEIPLDEAIRLGVTAATLTLQTAGAVVDDLTLEKLYDELVI